METGRATVSGLRKWLDRLLPPVCVLCGDPLERRDVGICGVCWSRAPTQRHPQCDRCGISLQDRGIPGATSSCTECADWLPYLVQARAPYAMEGTAAEMVHALKYGGWRALAQEMAERMGQVRFAAAVEAEITAVVAIPLSRTRQRERGFNQAELLGRSLAARCDRRFIDGLLVRPRHTRRQAQLSPRERQRNVAGAFEVVRERRREIEDAHLVLVDDVLTTAATALDCVRALCGSGVRAVSVVTFARARRQLPRRDV